MHQHPFKNKYMPWHEPYYQRFTLDIAKFDSLNQRLKEKVRCTFSPLDCRKPARNKQGIRAAVITLRGLTQNYNTMYYPSAYWIESELTMTGPMVLSGRGGQGPGFFYTFAECVTKCGGTKVDVTHQTGTAPNLEGFIHSK